MSLDQELLAQIDKYKEIMQKDPNSREFLTLAELYRKLGVAEEATTILQEGLNRHPDFVEARLAMARVYLTQGQVDAATKEFEEVILQDSGNFVAYKLLGEIAMQKQEHEKAAERFGAAYKLKPDDPECKVMIDYIGSLLNRDLMSELSGGGGGEAAEEPPVAQAATPGETIAVAPEARAFLRMLRKAAPATVWAFLSGPGIARRLEAGCSPVPKRTIRSIWPRRNSGRRFIWPACSPMNG